MIVCVDLVSDPESRTVATNVCCPGVVGIAIPEVIVVGNVSPSIVAVQPPGAGVAGTLRYGPTGEVGLVSRVFTGVHKKLEAMLVPCL